MSVADLPMPSRAGPRAAAASARPDKILIAASILLVGSFAALFQFRGTLAEYDLYWMLVGLLDGHATGLGTGASMHYGLSISFGYYELIDHLAPAAVLADPRRLIALMNAIGLVSAVGALAALAVAVSLAYGTRTAAVAVTLFGLSPLYLDMALSGHPLLPALAAFATGAALLFADLSGWRRPLLWSLATLLLFASLTIRAELLIGFGWLAVARADVSRLRPFLASVAERAIPPALAVAGFFVAQRAYVDPEAGGSGTLLDFLRTFYDLRNIGKGVGFLLIGLGPGLVVAAGAAALAWLGALRRVPAAVSAAAMLGPMALTLPCLVLWLPNPSPARHFALMALGAALLVGCMMARRPWGMPATLAALALCVAGNEIVSEALRPLLIARLDSPYVSFPERNRTLTQAPVGFAWRHHAAMQERHEAWDAEADRLGRSCDARIIVLGDERFEMIAGLYRDGRGAPRLSSVKLAGYDAIEAVRPDGQRIDFIEGYHAWPVDAVARLLATPETAGAAILQVPWSRSIHDHTPVPADRQLTLDCRAPPELRGSL